MQSGYERALWWLVVGFVIGFTIAIMFDDRVSASEDFVTSCVVSRDRTFDFRGTQFYVLACGQDKVGVPPRALLSIDADLPLAHALATFDRQRVAITISTAQRLER